MKKGNVEKLMDVLDTVGMYVFCLAGILVSKYIPALRQGGDIEIRISVGQFIVSCIVAFMVLSAAEQLGGGNGKTSEEKQKIRDGKRRRFLWRATAALSYGAFWHSMIGG